jgi:hypothetical protein
MAFPRLWPGPEFSASGIPRVNGKANSVVFMEKGLRHAKALYEAMFEQ